MTHNLSVDFEFGLDFTFEPVADDVVVTDALWAWPVDFWFEITDALTITHTHLLGAPQDVDYGYDIDDAQLSIEQHHVLTAGAGVDLPWEIDEIAVAVSHLLSVDPLDGKLEIDVPGVVGVTHVLRVDEAGFRIDPFAGATDTPVVQTRYLTTDGMDTQIAINDIWMYTLAECLSYDSKRLIDGGLQVDSDLSGNPSLTRWYDRDRYRFTLSWPNVSRSYAFGLVGFFWRYRYEKFYIHWPEDGLYYEGILARDVEINCNSHINDWRASIEFLSNGHPLIMPRTADPSLIIR